MQDEKSHSYQSFRHVQHNCFKRSSSEGSDKKIVHLSSYFSKVFYLPLAFGQEASHFLLPQRFSGSAGEGGEGHHPGVGQRLGTGQPGSAVEVDTEHRKKKEKKQRVIYLQPERGHILAYSHYMYPIIETKNVKGHYPAGVSALCNTHNKMS